MLTHTPDYVEDVDISNTDLALAGHTHGGQVSFSVNILRHIFRNMVIVFSPV